ncbi:transposase [Pandoraea sputorum]|uniref:transposase n=1 Tax=Pandoraea sputorum TaxID=93222 RepID=UPI00177C51AD
MITSRKPAYSGTPPPPSGAHAFARAGTTANACSDEAPAPFRRLSDAAANARNGNGVKTVPAEGGAIRIEVPRERPVSFEPTPVLRHEGRFAGVEDPIVALVLRGMVVREIQRFPLEQYGREGGLGRAGTLRHVSSLSLSLWRRHRRGYYPTARHVAGAPRWFAPGVLRAAMPAATRDGCT